MSSTRPMEFDEENFVRDQLFMPQESILDSCWVTKHKGEKTEERLIVVTNHRVLSLKRNRFGAKSLRRSGHLYTLERIVAEKDSSVIELYFRDFTLIFEHDDINAILLNILSAHKIITLHFKISSLSIDTSAIHSSFLSPLPDLTEAQSRLGGYQVVYEAFCTMYAQCAAPEIYRLLALLDDNSTILNLSSIPELDSNHPNSIEILPILEALTGNSHFTDFSIKGIIRKDAADYMAAVLAVNKTLRSVSLVELGASTGFSEIGFALQSNKDTKIRFLDFQGNNLRDDGTINLSSALEYVPIQSLGLASCRIGPKGIITLCAMLEASKTQFPLIALNLSRNSMGKSGTVALCQLLQSSRCQDLITLKLSDCRTDIPMLSEALRDGVKNLKVLDLSRHRFNKADVSDLVDALKKNLSICDLDINTSDISADQLLELLLPLLQDENRTAVSINLSGIQFSTKDIQHLAAAFQYSPCLHTLHMDACGMNGAAMKALFKILSNTNIHRLFASYNLTAESSERSDTIGALIEFMNSSESLETLSLCGDEKTYLGEAIIPLFKALDSNTALKRLEAFGNRYGDVGASYVGEMLCTNTTLESLDIDEGCVSLTGLKALLSGILKNNSVKLYRFPDLDVERLRKAAGKDWETEKEEVMRVIQEIGERVNQNRTGTKDGNTDGDESDDDYFMSVSKLPNSSSFRDIGGQDEKKTSPKGGMIGKMARSASRKKKGGLMFAKKKLEEENQKLANVQVNVSRVFSQQPRRTRGDTVLDWKMSLNVKEVVEKGEFLEESMEDGISISTTFDGSPPRMPVPSLVIDDDSDDDDDDKIILETELDDVEEN